MRRSLCALFRQASLAPPCASARFATAAGVPPEGGSLRGAVEARLSGDAAQEVRVGGTSGGEAGEGRGWRGRPSSADRKSVV